MHGLKKITVRGLKGLDGTYDLGVRVLVQGGVGSGKSGLIDAVRFAFLGMIPAQGKSIGASARLFDSQGGSVSIELTDGRTFGHAYTPRGKRKVEAHASWVTDPDAQTSEITEQIRGLIGSSEEEAIEVLYGDSLVKCTPQQRATRLRQVLTMSGDPVWRGAAIRALTARRLNGANADVHVPLVTAAADELAAAMLGSPLIETCEGNEVLARGVRQLLYALAGKEVEDLDAALTKANREKREWAAVKREAQGAQQVAEKSLGEMDDPGESIAGVKKRLEQATREAEGADKDAKAVRALNQALDVAVAELGRMQEVAARCPEDPDAEVDRIRQEAKNRRAEAETIVVPEAPERPEPARASPAALKEEQDLRQRLAPLERRLEALRSARPNGPAVVTSEDLDGAVDRLFAAWDAYGFGREVEVALGTFRRQWGGRQQKGDEWEKYEATLAKWSSDCRELEASISETQRRAMDVVQADQQRIDDENEKARRAWLAEDAKASVQRERAKARRAVLLQEAEQMEAAAATQARVWATAAERLAGAEAVVEKCKRDLAEVRDLDALLATWEKAEERALEVGLALQRVERYAGMIASLRQAETRLQEAGVKEQMYSAAEWAMQRVREHELMQSREALIGPMQVFYDAATGEAPVFEAQAGKVEFGLRKAGADDTYPVEALSGGEFVLYATALAAALLSLRKPQVRLLLIEAVECGLTRFGGVSVELLRGIAAIDGHVATTMVASNLPLTEDASEADPMGEWVTLNV